MFGIAVLHANAQGTGDLNGDGQFDRADFPLIAACMAGPADPLQPGCDDADDDDDGKFTLRDLMRIIRKLPTRPTADCDMHWMGTRFYLGYRADAPQDADFEGAGVTVNASDAPLCGENAGYGPFALSATWVGIAQTNTMPYATAQLGFISGRAFPIDQAGAPPTPNPERFHKLYFEIIWDTGENLNQPQDPQFITRLWTVAASPPVTFQFEVWRETNFLGDGQGIFFGAFIEGFPEDPLLFQTYYPTIANHGLVNRPNSVTFTSETGNTGDHVAGTVFRSCAFYDCVLFDRFFGPRQFDFDHPLVERLNDHNPRDVGIQSLGFVPNSAFEIWDRRTDR